MSPLVGCPGPGGFLSGGAFVQVDFFPKGLLLGGTFARGDFCPGVLLSGKSFARVDFCPGGLCPFPPSSMRMRTV